NKIKNRGTIDIYFNNSCPICKREISIYKSRSTGIVYNDSSLLENKYNRRMHAYLNGVEYVGARAFILIWKNTKGFKWLSYLLDNRICIFIMNLFYEPFAFYLYNMHLRRIKK
ncbi:MAG: DCC1-like thiol-disulfide oxidoreductase family protein, partial [Alphaproteobacteria bacterium]